MSYLIDTAVFLWMIAGEESRISKKALKALEEGDLTLSAVSLWEIAIKYSLGKLELEDAPEHWLPEVILKMNLRQLAISPRHALGVVQLSSYHKDPFDRLLISQSKLETLPLISPDPIFRKYKVKTIW